MIDKPVGITTAEVVTQVQQVIKQTPLVVGAELEVGACGLVPLLIGPRESKLQSAYTADEQEYVLTFNIEGETSVTMSQIETNLARLTAPVKTAAIFQCFLPGMLQLKLIVNGSTPVTPLVQTLMKDLGIQHYTVEIVRVRSGFFTLADAVPLDHAAAEYERYQAEYNELFKLG